MAQDQDLKINGLTTDEAVDILVKHGEIAPPHKFHMIEAFERMSKTYYDEAALFLRSAILSGSGDNYIERSKTFQNDGLWWQDLANKLRTRL
jgi:hypothetical protein